MPASLKATILIPTHGGRGRCLRYTVDSMLRQTVPEVEVFIMGDGVNEESREIILGLCAADSRVRFFDNPKHIRRGEPYRHEVLMNEARGEIVCYCCDHDLFLPDHVEKMHAALQEADFAHSFTFGVLDDGTMICPTINSLEEDPEAPAELEQTQILVPLDFGAHRLDFYKNLPPGRGWRDTPEDWCTDGYFYNSLVHEPGVRIKTVYDFTVIYLPRPRSIKRQDNALYEQEIAGWHQRLIEPGFTTWFRDYAMRQLVLFWSGRRRGHLLELQHQHNLRDILEATMQAKLDHVNHLLATAAAVSTPDDQVPKLTAKIDKLRETNERQKALIDKLKREFQEKNRRRRYFNLGRFLPVRKG